MKRGQTLRGNKGLSPVIASVLLILLVMVLASLIFFWARGFFTENIEKQGQPIQNLCEEIAFEVEKIGTNENTMILEVLNRGNIDIYQLDIKMFDDKGNSEISQFKFNIDAGKSTKGEVYTRMKDNTQPTKISVYPALIGTVQGRINNKIYTCNNKGKTLTL